MADKFNVMRYEVVSGKDAEERIAIGGRGLSRALANKMAARLNEKIAEDDDDLSAIVSYKAVPATA
jgi:hypothetical protein